MAGDSSPCLSVYGLISVKMANDLRVWVRSTKAAQFSGRGARLVQTFDMSRRNNSTNESNNHSQGLDHHVKKGRQGDLISLMLLATQFSVRGARCGTDLDMSRRNNSTNKSNNHSQGLDHHVKKGRRGICQQKATTVLPDRTATT